MKLLQVLSALLCAAAFLLTILFVFGKLGGLGVMGGWSWGTVFAPLWIYALWILLWVILGMALYAWESRLPRGVRDPYRTFEPLRRFRAWRWARTQKKYNLTDKEI